MNLKKYIEHNAPQVTVTGGEYPPGDTKQLMARLLGFIQMGLMALLFLGDTVFRALNMEAPAFYRERIQNNKMVWFMGLWFVGG